MEFIELDLENVSEEKLIEAIESNNSKLTSILKSIELLEKKPHMDKVNNQEKKTVLSDVFSDEVIEKDNNLDFEGEIDYYFSMIDGFGLTDNLFDDIQTSLPSKKNSNYKNIVLRIKMELLKNIKEISDLLNEEQDELTSEDLEDFKAEIKLNNQKIEIINKIENLEQEVSKEENVKNNLIFVPTSSGNIRVLEELNDISAEYLPGFKGLFDSIIDGSFKNVKRFNSSNNKNSGISEVKDYKIRVVFDRIGQNDYAILTAFIKKTDKDKGYLEALNLKVKNYESQKDMLKSNLKNPEFMELQSQYTTELLNMLESRDKANYVYRKGEK